MNARNAIGFNSLRLWALCFILLMQAAAGSTTDTAQALNQTALDRYVATPDPAYRFTLVNEWKTEDFAVQVYDMVSQNWLTGEEVDRTEWHHWLTIIRPNEVTTPTALLFIGGGENTDPPPTRANPLLAGIAMATRTVVAELSMVPNQPLAFTNEAGRKRWEDALIAWTWDRYLRTGDERYPARLPMTKSAVRAMDAVSEILAEAEKPLQVDQFVVAGASKRGWTTWTTAAVDKRVVAIVPIVIDMLNIVPSFQHHWQVYGFWAPAIDDYVEMDIPEWFETPQFAELMNIVEPYEYRERLTMPKLLINATGDQFFLPDSSQFYFDELPGENYLRYVPNTGHSLEGSDAAQSLLAFYDSVVYERERPEFHWESLDANTLRITTQDTPTTVTLWQAHNPQARDFRLDTIGKAWKPSRLEPDADEELIARIDTPEIGWRAWFVELEFSSEGPAPFKLTTPVQVVPERRPFPPYEPKPIR